MACPEVDVNCVFDFSLAGLCRGNSEISQIDTLLLAADYLESAESAAFAKTKSPKVETQNGKKNTQQSAGGLATTPLQSSTFRDSNVQTPGANHCQNGFKKRGALVVGLLPTPRVHDLASETPSPCTQNYQNSQKRHYRTQSFSMDTNSVHQQVSAPRNAKCMAYSSATQQVFPFHERPQDSQVTFRQNNMGFRGSVHEQQLQQPLYLANVHHYNTMQAFRQPIPTTFPATGYRPVSGSELAASRDAAWPRNTCINENIMRQSQPGAEMQRKLFANEFPASVRSPNTLKAQPKIFKISTRAEHEVVGKRSIRRSGSRLGSTSSASASSANSFSRWPENMPDSGDQLAESSESTAMDEGSDVAGNSSTRRRANFTRSAKKILLDWFVDHVHVRCHKYIDIFNVHRERV